MARKASKLSRTRKPSPVGSVRKRGTTVVSGARSATKAVKRAASKTVKAVSGAARTVTAKATPRKATFPVTRKRSASASRGPASRTATVPSRKRNFSTHSEDVARAWDMMKDMDFCMFVTRDGAGMDARPMSTIVDRDAGVIHILTEADSSAAQDVHRHGHAIMAFSNGSNKFVSCASRVAVAADEALVTRLWNPGAQAFWPEGPTASNVVALVCRPQHAEFWEGPSKVVSTVRFAYAIATGSTPDMGENRQVRL